MASSQEKEEKARFFEHLYRLDDLVSDDESHDEASDTSHDQHTARPVKFREQSRHTDEPYSGTRSRNILQAHAKKRLHEEPSQPAPIVIEDEGDGDNRESRNLSPARKKKTRFEVKTKNATKPTNLPVKAEKRNSTNILNLKQRKRQVPKSMKLTAVPIEQQFFREFIFCTYSRFLPWILCHY